MLDGQALEADGLRAFSVFARHLNFTSAAAELLISQPSLHVKIRKLGAALGVELYERQGRRLVLTDAGQRLAAFGEDSRRRAEDFLTALRPAGATVAVAAGRSTLRWVVADGLRRLVDGGRSLRVFTADRAGALRHLAAGQADVAVIAHEPPPPGLRSLVLASYPQTLVLPRDHRLARRRGVSIADLAGLDLVLPPAGRPHREALEGALHDAGTRVQVAAEVDGWDLMVHFVGLGLGASVVNGCVPPPEGLAAVPVTDLPPVTYWATWRGARDGLAAPAAALLTPGRRRASR